jgi:hypothetical protein
VRAAARALVMAALLAVMPAWASDAREDAAQLAIAAEHVAKLHAQVLHGVGADRARRALAQASRAFDGQLRTAAARSPPALHEHYALLTLLWREHRAWIARPAGRDAARSEADRDDELTWLTRKGQRLAGPMAAPAEDASLAACLSQRVARVAIARHGERVREGDGLEALRAALGRLEAAEGGDAGVAAELQVARNQFLFLARALDEGGPRNLDVAARSADNILEALQRAMRRMPSALSPSPG